MLTAELGWPAPGSDFALAARQLEERCLRTADAIYSSSACSADWVAREYGLDRASIPVMHTGVDTRQFAPRKIERDPRPTIVFAGKVTWNKGVMPLLEAALKIAPNFEGLRLRMLGRGDEKVMTALRQRAAAEKREKLLELLGFVDRETLAAELCHADIFAAPSRYEGGPGFVYLEAMACGLPVIACQNSGAAEVVVPGENGALVPPDDVDALANALRQLLADRVSMGNRARGYVVRNFDTNDCVKRIETFFSHVASAHR
jgi:glycogen(starch) synthase